MKIGKRKLEWIKIDEKFSCLLFIFNFFYIFHVQYYYYIATEYDQTSGACVTSGDLASNVFHFFVHLSTTSTLMMASCLKFLLARINLAIDVNWTTLQTQLPWRNLFNLSILLRFAGICLLLIGNIYNIYIYSDHI